MQAIWSLWKIPNYADIVQNNRQTKYNQMGITVFQQSFIYKNRWARFGPWAAICQHVVWKIVIEVLSSVKTVALKNVLMWLLTSAYLSKKFFVYSVSLKILLVEISFDSRIICSMCCQVQKIKEILKMPSHLTLKCLSASTVH